MIVLQALQYLLCARSGLPLRLPERLPPTATVTSLAVRVLCDAFVARVRAARLLLVWPARHYGDSTVAQVSVSSLSSASRTRPGKSQY